MVGLCLALQSVAARADPTFPTLTGRVVDDAQLLSPEAKRTLTDELAALEQKTGAQLVVVTLPSLQGYDIADFGYRLGRAWGIGQAGKDNGALLIVAPNERRVRIEVGRGLEPTLTDAATKLIIENGITPRFRQGDYAGGIQAGARDIIAVVQGDEAALEALKARGAQPADPAEVWIVLAVWLLIFLIIIWIIWQSSGPGGSARRGGPAVFFPGGSSSGGWSSSGGGFSGGGGDFGGGGASGSW